MAPEGDDRRRMDKDHDLLVQTAELCKNTNEKLDTFIDRIDARCEGRIRVVSEQHTAMTEGLEGKLSTKMFMWLMGLLIGALIIVTGLVGANSISISQLHIYMEDNAKHIEKHSDVIEELRKLSHHHDKNGQ